MKKLIIDGSNKGFVIGAGIVEVDRYGFLKTHSFNTLHENANSFYAELFAFEKALDCIHEEENIEIFTDSKSIIDELLAPEVEDESPYVAKLKKKMKKLKKKRNLSLLLVTDEQNELLSIARRLSREYLSNEKLQQFFYDESESKVDSLENCEELFVRVIREDKKWKLYANDQLCGESKQFLKALTQFVTQHPDKKITYDKQTLSLLANCRNKEAKDLIKQLAK